MALFLKHLFQVFKPPTCLDDVCKNVPPIRIRYSPSDLVERQTVSWPFNFYIENGTVLTFDDVIRFAVPTETSIMNNVSGFFVVFFDAYLGVKVPATGDDYDFNVKVGYNPYDESYVDSPLSWRGLAMPPACDRTT